MRLVAIDPDTKKPGVACFVDGALSQAFALPVERALHWMPAFVPDIVLCEMPQQYGRKGDQRDFLALARVVGRFEQLASEKGYAFEAIKPAQWKGTTPKAVCTLRVWEELSTEERWGRLRLPASARSRLERGQGLSSGEGSDVLDAIGIGLWKLGRLHKKTSLKIFSFPLYPYSRSR